MNEIEVALINDTLCSKNGEVIDFIKAYSVGFGGDTYNYVIVYKKE